MSEELQIKALSLLLDAANQKPIPQVLCDVALEWIAEHDPTPVDAEWLDRVMGEPHVSQTGCKTWTGRCVQVIFEPEVTHCGDILRMLLLSRYNEFNPTRGDVLTALRLFRETE